MSISCIIKPIVPLGSGSIAHVSFGCLLDPAVWKTEVYEITSVEQFRALCRERDVRMSLFARTDFPRRAVSVDGAKFEQCLRRMGRVLEGQ